MYINTILVQYLVKNSLHGGLVVGQILMHSQSHHGDHLAETLSARDFLNIYSSP